MKLGLRNYTVIMSNEKSCIKFNNNRLNSLQSYDIAQNYTVLHRMIQRLFQHKLKILHHRHTKGSAKRK
jgi:hypothetical protein